MSVKWIQKKTRLATMIDESGGVTVGKALLFPSSVEALGDRGEGLGGLVHEPLGGPASPALVVGEDENDVRQLGGCGGGPEKQ